MNRPAPRYQGKISSWKDEQGFGFISPNGGGSPVFVHISAFAGRGTRPVLGDIVTYHLGANDRGPCAQQVAYVRGQAAPPSAPGGRMLALLVAAGFLGFAAACVFTRRLPSIVVAVYLGASVLAYLFYALDKAAARKGAGRTPESTLHMIGLLGGWPGALVAQQMLRHKTRKAEFRTTFWATVIVNCGVLAWFLSGHPAFAA